MASSATCYSLLAIRYSPSCRRSSHLAPEREAIEMREHLFDVHDVGVFVMQIEQIDLVADQRAVVGAFLDHHVVEAVGIGVDGGGAHAAGGAFAADDEAV